MSYILKIGVVVTALLLGACSDDNGGVTSSQGQPNTTVIFVPMNTTTSQSRNIPSRSSVSASRSKPAVSQTFRAPIVEEEEEKE